MPKVSSMRVPRALEFPAVILTTAVLTFTGVSALQASVNAPLASMAKERAEKSSTQAPAFDPASEVTPAVNFFAVLRPDEPPAVLQPLPAKAEDVVPAEAVVLAGTGSMPAAEEITSAGTAVQPVPVAVPAPAQAAVAAVEAAVASRPAPPPPPAPPVQAAATPPPTPVSGMDYVWDQVFGSGSFAKPGTPASSNNGKAPAPPPQSSNGKAGVGQACPPGQAKKGNC